MKKYLAINITAIFSLLVIAGSIFYFFVIYPPILEKQRISKLEACEAQGIKDFATMWNNECKRQGLGEDCTDLPTDVVNTINNYSRDSFDTCRLKYPH